VVIIANQIDLGLMKIAFPTSKAADLIPWIEPFQKACKEFGIDTIRELASFLGNIAVESQDLRSFSENLNYSVAGLLSTFGRHRITAADCQRLGRKPGEGALSHDRQRQIANLIYGGEWGRINLGNIKADDGWNFRGYGPKQLTGRANHEAFARAIGKRVEEIPDYIRTREGGARSAGWFWKSHNLDPKAATPGVEDDRKAINGGFLGVEILKKRFDLLVAELLRRGC
jgi:putative chitinase